MDRLYSILLEQESTMSTLRKSIGERIPISIYYQGPPEEVRTGQRIDIEPIVMGKNSKSGNLVIWAYVFKGVSKKGLPGWKMFRVDRINSAKLNPSGNKFKLEELPGYVKGKAPAMMKSLSSVEIFSPYWFDKDEKYTPQPHPTDVPVEPEIPVKSTPKPNVTNNSPGILANKVYSELQPQIQNQNNRKIVSRTDYETALKNLANYQEDQWKVHQRMISGNERPGTGTRKRFNDTSKFELDRVLAQNNVDVDNNVNMGNNEMLAEGRRIQTRIKRLINW